MFDRIAPRYDLLNRILSAGIDVRWRKKAIRHLQESQPEEILDIATGTGDLVFMAQAMLAPENITGVDIAERMLDIARSKAVSRGLSGKVKFETGDAENLHFPGNSFDAVTVAFGVRNFEDLNAGLMEMHRVLRPGGDLVILEFTTPRLFPFKQVYHAYFRYVLPWIGKMTSRDPRAYRYLYESVQAFPDEQGMCTILGEIGYRQVNYKTLTFGICALYTAKK